MAKGKRSVALFEVIQSANTARRSAMLRTPSWWFKRRQGVGQAESAQSAAACAPVVAELSEAPSSAPAPRTAGIDLKLDSDHQRITFQLSYMSAAVAAFAVVAVLGLAVIIGQRLSHGGPTPALAGATTEQLRTVPANPAVLSVNSNANSTSARRSTTAPPSAAQTPDRTVTPSAPPAALITAPTTSPSGQRVLGLQYVVVQSYPTEEKQWADDACALLNKRGIPSTVETGVQGFGAYSVVGLRGFPRASGDEYDTYEKAIRTVSDEFAKNARNAKFKRFDPHPISAKYLKITAAVG